MKKGWCNVVEEIELRIAQDKEEVEKLLLSQGFKIFFKRRTIANYYLPESEEIGDHKTLKDKSVRLRTSYKIDENIGKLGFSKLDLSKTKDEEKLTFKEAKKQEKQLIKSGFKLLHTDDKTDFVYILEDTGIAFQIQDIKGFGTIVAYDNKNYYHLSRAEQRKKLIEDVKKYGIQLESLEQVDRFAMIDKTKKLSIKEIALECLEHNQKISQTGLTC